jgi:uncharacterized protein YggU (UPF0235/DUF167 family)
LTYWREDSAGLIIAVRLTPKAAVDRIEAIATLADGRTVLKARVRAVPEKGKANAALEELIARALGVPKSAVSVIAGGTSRLKSVRVDGCSDFLAAAMEKIC